MVHYHFGTMDHLLAALVRRSFAQARAAMRKRFTVATIGEDIWEQYSLGGTPIDAVELYMKSLFAVTSGEKKPVTP